jgi:hypothetical protein
MTLWAAGSSLKVVSTISVGFGKVTTFWFDKQGFIISSPDHVDLRGLYRRKVRLGYTPDILTDASESILLRAL